MNIARGFSLVELLVVLAIVAMLALVSAPLATGWIRNAQLERDFAGIQRALSTTKSLAMRNITGAAGQAAAFVPAAALCRAGETLIIVQRGVPNPNDEANCNRVVPASVNNKPVYSMGQDVVITFGSNNQAFCGAAFDARGSVRMCRGANCSTCDVIFDPRSNSGALKVTVIGADTTSDPSNDQSQLIRAF